MWAQTSLSLKELSHGRYFLISVANIICKINDAVLGGNVITCCNKTVTCILNDLFVDQESKNLDPVGVC